MALSGAEKMRRRRERIRAAGEMCVGCGKEPRRESSTLGELCYTYQLEWKKHKREETKGEAA